jgi:lysophospholipase L1-like esterase
VRYVAIGDSFTEGVGGHQRRSETAATVNLAAELAEMGKRSGGGS